MDWKTRIPALILWLALVFSSVDDGNAEQRIVCYYTNWSVYRPGTAKFSPQNINPYLCTHLIYAFGGFTKENTLKPFDKYQDIEKGGYAKFTGLKTYNKNLKTMLAIGGWNEGSSRFSPMVADPGRRKEFVKNSVKFLRQNHFDGLDLDWEYPAFRDGGKPRDRNNYADLVQELREEFERESSKTGRPRLLLSMAVPAGIEYIDKGYDVPRLNDYLDFINLLSYDYHSAFEPAVNHHAPLYPLEEDNEYNYDTELTIDYTIEHLLKSGASSEKIVLGIPTYGRSYTLFNEDATEIGAPADGPGEEGDATREKGYLAYYEICESVGKSDEWEIVQPNPAAMGPYAFREKQWVGYDDQDIVRAKARYVNEKKLGGIMFWSIDNDDFRGKCHGRPYPLIEAAKEAMLAGDEKSSSGLKTKLSDTRKKNRNQAGQRIQGNSIARKLGNRRTTTQTPTSRRRIQSSRSNARSNHRGGNKAAEDEQEEDETEVNSVKSIEKPRTRSRSKTRSNNRVSAGSRRKQNSRRGGDKENEANNEESLSNKLTTPEPPTTPDPGSDFKCEEDGFFPHPRDCKKYFWCLDSGPSGLGIVAHQFTCPSGLVFNKAADSCDYPRNVVCPKAKTSQSAVTTTRAPITAATSRTTYLYKPAQRTTTSKPESEEEYEYYDDEDEDEQVADSEEIEDHTTTSAKPLLYKTISRSRPTTTTTATPVTTTTEAATSPRIYKTTSERIASFEDEEDPRVIKELIDLIKKAGGIEQLEKQLNYQEKNSGSDAGTTEVNGGATPVPISRSLYERVLNRQATRNAGGFLGTFGSTTRSANGSKSDRESGKNARIGFVNAAGGAQFQGLDDIPEVKNLRRTNKPQYVTIERNRTRTSERPDEDDEEIDEDDEEDNTDVASSEEQAVSNPPHHRPSNRRVTPSYVNIRRQRPSTTTSENDVEVKDDVSEEEEEEEQELAPPRHRIVKTEEEPSTLKSRYTNTQRFRSTTSRSGDGDQVEQVTDDHTTESATTTTTTEKVIPVEEEIEEISSSTLSPSSATSESSSSSVSELISSSIEPATSSIPESTSDSSLKLVENSATEILLTTAAASSSSSGSSTPESLTRRSTIIAAVSQPRPFGFPRRGRPTASTSSVAPVTEQSRTKVVSETLRLPTLKELVGYAPTRTETIPEYAIIQNPTTFVDKTIDMKALGEEETIDREVAKDRMEIVGHDLANRDDSAEYDDSRDKDIFDNDILGSEEIQRRSSSSSFVTEAPHARSTYDFENVDLDGKYRRVEIPVRILDDANGEEIGDLVILRVPQSKLNSAILKPVFRVKVLDQDTKDRKNLEKESVPSFVETSSENELSDDRRSPSRRRRIRINSSPVSAAFGVTAAESEYADGSGSRPRNRQRIVKARRRTRGREGSPIETGESVSTGREGTQVQNDQTGFERPNRTDARSSSDESVAIEYSPESTTTIIATTLRGNLSTTPKALIRGFYVTKSSVETTWTPEVATTDSPMDSTQYPSATTGNDLVDEKTEQTDFATTDHETVTPSVEGIPYFTQDIRVGTTVDEADSTTRTFNNVHSARNVASSMERETWTTRSIATTDDGVTESDPSMTVTTEEKTSQQPEVTTFRPWMTVRFQTTIPTTLMESTTSAYVTDDTESVEPAQDLTENLKASANSHYGDHLDPEARITAPPTVADSDDDDDDSKTNPQTSGSMESTTMQEEPATTYKGAVSRGRVRFAATKTDDRKTLIESEAKTVEHVSINTTERLQTLTRHSKNNLRRTTSKTDESTVDDVTGNPVTFHSTEARGKTVTTPTKFYDKNAIYTSIAPNKRRLTTNIVGTTGSGYNRDQDSTKYLADSDNVSMYLTTDEDSTKTSTVVYDRTLEYASATPETENFVSNLVEPSSNSSYGEMAQNTTESMSDSDDSMNNSTTEKDSSTSLAEIYDKTTESYMTTEADYLSTNFIEITENRLYTGPLLDETATVATATDSYEKMTEISEPATVVNVADSHEEEDATESTMTDGTTSSWTEMTKKWNYGQPTSGTVGPEDFDTESSSISNDVTADVKIDPTTIEAYLTTDRAEMATMTEEAGTKIDDEYKSSTGSTLQTTETMSILEKETREQLFTASPSASVVNNDSQPTPAANPAQTTMKNIVTSTATESSPTYSSGINGTNEPITEEKPRTAIDPSKNATAPVTPSEIKRTRGRVRFTNFAASIDETGKAKRPVKQVVVRRRLANQSKNHHRTIAASPEIGMTSKSRPNPNRRRNESSQNRNSVNLDEHLDDLDVYSARDKKHRTSISDDSAERKKHIVKSNEGSVDEKRIINGTKTMRRRVVVYRGRPRAETTTWSPTTTVQSLIVSSDETPDYSSETRRRKWRKRIVLKRPRSEESDDQIIAETSDYRRALIDDTILDFGELGSSVEDRALVRSDDRADEDIVDEVNPYKSSGGFLRRPGSLIRRNGINRTRVSTQGNATPISPTISQTAVFSKIQPVGGVKADDQSVRAQEFAVTLADPPAVQTSATSGRLPFRFASPTRKISTTIAPRTEAPTTWRTTPVVRRRPSSRGSVRNDRVVVENSTTRPRRPAIIDYDYYVDDDDVRLVVKPELKDKLYVTRRGGIRCLDQGNFAHPTSCKKFITCARMVNGQVIGTEYTCPDKLSFDPVGGICNWSAGVGCEEKKA